MMKPHGRLMGTFLSLLVVLALGGCATLPKGPSVRVLPGPEKTFEQFQGDDLVCRQWAGQQTGSDAQRTATRSTISSAAVGTALGAGAGAMIGAATGRPGAGAAIGGGGGLLLGSTAGAGAGQTSGSEAQRRYDNAYAQCMYAKGHQVPGAVRVVPPARVAPQSVPPDYYPPAR